MAVPRNQLFSIRGSEFSSPTSASSSLLPAMPNHPSDEMPLSEEERYQQLIDRCTDGILLIRDARIRTANQAAVRILGYTASEHLRGRPLAEVLQSGSPEPYLSFFEETRQLADGSTIDAEVTIVPYLDSGAFDGQVVVIRDISARKRIAASLSQQDQSLRLITDALPVFIAECDRDYRINFVNKTYADRFGYQPSDAIGKRIPEVMGEEAFATLRQHIDAALRGQPQEHEVRVPSPNGEENTLHIMYMP